MPFDVDSATRFAREHAAPFGTHNCAHYVRLAIKSGGVSLHPTHYAKDYGQSLEAAGFHQTVGPVTKGDVIVIQPAPGHPAGHMAIYDGSIWISDFKQMHPGPHGFYPGEAYRQAQPAYKIYRYK